MKTLCVILALLVPATAAGQAPTYIGAPCAPDDNECLLRGLLFQTRAIADGREKAQHLQSALDAKTAESQALQSALSKEQRDAVKSGGDRGMWVGVGVIGGVILTTLIVFVTNRASKP